LTALLRAHAEREAAATIALHPVEDSAAFGLVERGEAGEVLAFREKTGERVPGEINAGMYVLERSVLDLIPPAENVSIERDVFPRLAGHGLHGLRLDGYWVDIGTPERYLQASWDILEGRVATRVEPSSPGVLVDPRASVSPEATIGPRAVVGPGCRVEAGAEVRESVLLDGAEVRAGAHVVGSILAPGASVELGADVEGAVAAERERLPA
jgi:mannose-1-phosphate guanylyltransferase